LGGTFNRIQRRRESIAANRAYELGINPRIGFEPIGNAGAGFDLAQKMTQRRGSEVVQMLNESLAPRPLATGCNEI
jgi:hypothetical protein